MYKIPLRNYQKLNNLRTKMERYMATKSFKAKNENFKHHAG